MRDGFKVLQFKQNIAEVLHGMQKCRMSKHNRLSISQQCPCGSGKTYSACCQLLHVGNAAQTAEALMRSRYTAYVLGLEDYLLQTWHPDTRPAALGLAADTQTKWLGLEIKWTELLAENNAIVEFAAKYKVNGKAERLHEVSSFIKIDGNWYYVDGIFTQDND